MTDKTHFNKKGESFCKGGFSWSPLTEDKLKVTCRKCIKLINIENPSLDYSTLEQDLIKCFEKRGIEVELILVEEGCTKYTIKVKRK